MNHNIPEVQSDESFKPEKSSRRHLYIGMLSSSLLISAGLLGFWFGRGQDSSSLGVLPLRASTADSTDSMAMATGLISEDTEGVFFIDFNTGDLQCLVFYPRSGAFGAHYYTNVRAQLGGVGKNSKYIIATGFASPRAATIGARPAGSLVYVTDVNTGMFAAYAVPWDRNAEATGRPQAGPLVFVGGGPIRNYQLQNPQNAQPAAVVDPNGNKNP